MLAPDGAITVDAGQDVELFTVTPGGDAGDNATLTAGVDMVLGGNILAGDADIIATAGNDIDQDGVLNAENVTLTADTGSLDSENGLRVLELLAKLNTHALRRV